MDRAAGGILGAIQAILIVWLAGGLLAAGPFPTLGRAATQSVVVRGVDQILPPPTEVVGEIAGALDASGLPDVFVGLDPLPLPAGRHAVGPPGRAHRRRRGRRHRAHHDPRLRQPGQRDRRRHRAAATSSPTPTSSRARARSGSTIGSDVADAGPVLFDPDLDVAVLHAPDLDGPAPPLRDRRPGSRRRPARPSATRAAARSSCCRPRSRARTRRPVTTSTTGRRSAARSSSCARRSSPATRGGPLILERRHGRRRWCSRSRAPTRTSATR